MCAWEQVNNSHRVHIPVDRPPINLVDKTNNRDTSDEGHNHVRRRNASYTPRSLSRILKKNDRLDDFDDASRRRGPRHSSRGGSRVVRCSPQARRRKEAARAPYRLRCSFSVVVIAIVVVLLQGGDYFRRRLFFSQPSRCSVAKLRRAHRELVRATVRRGTRRRLGHEDGWGLPSGGFRGWFQRLHR